MYVMGLCNICDDDVDDDDDDNALHHSVVCPHR